MYKKPLVDENVNYYVLFRSFGFHANGKVNKPKEITLSHDKFEWVGWVAQVSVFRPPEGLSWPATVVLEQLDFIVKCHPRSPIQEQTGPKFAKHRCSLRNT